MLALAHGVALTSALASTCLASALALLALATLHAGVTLLVVTLLVTLSAVAHITVGGHFYTIYCDFFTSGLIGRPFM